jgi:cobalt/nickel transport system permease protein
MVIGHGVLGLIEGAITASVYGYVVEMRPDLVFERHESDIMSAEVRA